MASNVELWVPDDAKKQLRQARLQGLLHYRHEVEELLKALQAEAPHVPRKIVPGLATLGVYSGIQDVRKLTDRTFSVLRDLAVPHVIRMIIETRIRQVQRYAKIPRFNGDTGFDIVLRETNARPTAGDLRRMDEIRQFLLDGGIRTKRALDGEWGVFSADGFDEALPFMDAISITVRDTLTLDAVAWWLHPSSDPNIPCVMFKPLDAALVRRCLVPLPENVELAGESSTYRPYEPKIRRDLKHPAFVMLDPNGNPMMEFGRGELAYMVRNPRSDWWTQGYGYAELESLVDIVIGLLTAVNYNVSYFTENHIPPAILVGTGEFSDEWLEDFLATITSQVGGPNKWHKLPALFGDEGARLELIPLRAGAMTDMLWREWLIFLINLACSVFHIAAEEVNFQAFLTRGGVLTQAAGAERVTAAQDTGLRPLLYQFEAFLDRNIVSRFWPDPRTGVGPYKFIFKGVDEENERDALQRDSLAIQAGLRTVNEVRQERGDPPYRDPLDDRLWSDCEEVVRKKLPELDRYPEAFREKVEQVYRAAGGKFARWPDAPGNPTLLQIWLQEHRADIAAQQQEEYGPDVGALLQGAGAQGVGTAEPQPGGETPQFEMPGGPPEPTEGQGDEAEATVRQGLLQRLFGAAKSLGGKVIEVFVRRAA